MRWTYRPELDGLRTVAVYLVVLFHTGLSVGRRRVHRRRPVLRALRLPGHRASSCSEIDGTGSAAPRPLLRPPGPAAAAGGGRRRSSRPAWSSCWWRSAVRRLPMVGDAQAALLYVANWHFLAPVATTTSPPTSTRARSCTSGRCRSRSSSTSSSRCSSLGCSPVARGAAPLGVLAAASAARRCRSLAASSYWARPHLTAPTTAPTPGSTSCSPAPCCAVAAAQPAPPRCPPRVGALRPASPASSASSSLGSGLRRRCGRRRAASVATVASVAGIVGWPCRASSVRPGCSPAGRSTSARSPTAPTSGTGRSSWSLGEVLDASPDRGRGDDDGSRHRPGRGCRTK